MVKPRQILVLAFVAALVGGIITLSLYIVCDYITMGSVIAENQIEYVQSSTAPPSGYKSNFGVWTVAYDKEKDTYSSTLKVPSKQDTISKYLLAGTGLGVVDSTGEFESALSNSTLAIAEQISYYKERFESFISSNPGCNADGINTSILSTATVANINSEGRVLQWENNILTKELKDRNSNVEIAEVESTKYYQYNCSCGSAFYFGTYIEDVGWYAVTKEQFENTYNHAKTCNAFADNSIGFGSVQWTGGRCKSYIIYMWENYIKDLPDGELSAHLADIKRVEADYVCLDVNNYLGTEDELLKNRDKSSITLVQLTAYIAGVFECPYYCYRYQRSYSDAEGKYLAQENKTTGETSIKQKSNYPGYTTMYTSQCEAQWDFKKYRYYWVSSGTSTQKKAGLTESYRVDRALSYWSEISADGV